MATLQEQYKAGLDALAIALDGARRRNLKPPPKLTGSQWAERNARLSPETSAQTGRFRAFPYQIGMMDAITDPSVTDVSVMKSARVGFALALDTDVPTMSGWTTMGAVSVGDVLFGADGKPCRVQYVSPIYVLHDCYRVTFCDGTTVVADAGHRWLVESDLSLEVLKGERPRGRIGRPKPGMVVTTNGIIDTAGMARICNVPERNRLAIRNTKALECSKADLPIGPYALGVWLGDGNYDGFRITCHRTDADEIAGYFAADGLLPIVEYTDRRNPNTATILSNIIPGNKKRSSSLAAILRRENLYKNKHVPNSYLRSSWDHRLALLQGLMDTDGSIGRNGFAEFTNTNRQLAESVFELVVSLGMKATFVSRVPSGRPIVMTDGNGTKYTMRSQLMQHRVVFKANKECNPFRLCRKANKVRNIDKPTITFRRKIVSVESVESVPVRCIQVDSPDSLFLCTKSMVPTHNTRILDNAIGYYIEHEPSPILMVQPRKEDAEDYSKTEIVPMLRDTPALRALAPDPKAKTSGETILKKSFLNGASLALIGANSPGGFRRITVRVVVFDEIDGYPTGGAGSEGDQIRLGKKRNETFWNRKTICGSTPTIEGLSRIQKRFDESDKRFYFVPCPHCGEKQTLEWGGKDKPFGIKWHKDEAGKNLPETAYYVCKINGCVIDEADKPGMIAAGEWIATAPFKGHAGFHISTLYSLFPNASWVNLATEWLEVKNNPLERQTFINTTLGLPYEDRGDKALSEDALLGRRELYAAEVPDGVALLTAGVDVQDDRLEIEVVGWGRDEESWSLALDVLEGDPEQPELWGRLDEYLKRIWRRADGRGFEAGAVCVDSGGHHTQKVYEFCKARLGRRIWAIKGESARGGQRSPVWPVKRPTSRTKASFRPVILGVNAAKDVIRARLHLAGPPAPDMPLPGYMHFPTDRDVNYFAQLVAERSVLKMERGQKFRVWELPAGRANEALDCRVYAYGALCGLLHLGLKLNRKADEVKSTIGPPMTVPAGGDPAVHAAVKPKAKSLISRLA